MTGLGIPLRSSRKYASAWFGRPGSWAAQEALATDLASLHKGPFLKRRCLTP